MEQIELRADCPWCGDVEISARDMRCALERRGLGAGICEFNCPICSRLLIAPTAPDESADLINHGASTIHGRVPFELLERHVGSPIGWDDVLDVRITLATTCCPQEELAA